MVENDSLEEDSSEHAPYWTVFFSFSLSLLLLFHVSRLLINMVFVILRVPHTIESGFDHSLQLSQVFSSCALFFASIAGVYLQVHIVPYSGISRISVASYHRKHIWPRGWGISELKRFIHYLTAFNSQTQAQLSISRIHCYLNISIFRDQFPRSALDSPLT